MNTIPLASWGQTNQKALEQLTSNEIWRCAQLQDAANVKARTIVIKSSVQSSSFDHILPRVEKLIDLSTPVCDAIHTLTGRSSGVASLMWGILGLAIESTAREAEYLDLVVKMYEDMLSNVPRFRQSLIQNIKKHVNLEHALFDVHQIYISVGIRTIKVFGRGSISIITKLKWKRDQKQFHTSVRGLKRLKDLINSEAGAVNAADEQHWRQEILAAITGNETASVHDINLHPRAVEQGLQYPIFAVPFSPNASFLGRGDEFSTIESTLGVRNTTARNRLRSVVLHGLGGVGKTQLAVEFCHRYRDQYDVCFWIGSDTLVKLAQGFAEIAKRLKLEAGDDAQTRTRVKDWLSTTEKSWLLVFDNAEDPNDLDEYWPHAAKGAIMITTQNRNWLQQERINFGLRLESFSTHDGVQMLQSVMQRYGTSIVRQNAEDIVKEVGGLPLAIRQIGSYIATTNASPGDFLNKYQDHEISRRIDSWHMAVSQPTDRTLATVWNLALDKLSTQSVFLLNVMVMLDPDSIPADLFVADIESGSLSWLLADFEAYEKCISEILSYSLVTQSIIDESKSTLSIHRQVRRNILYRMQPLERQKAFEWIQERLRREFPQQSPFAEPLSRSWDQCNAWISHVIAMNGIAKGFKSTLQVPESLVSILVDGSIYLWERGLLQQGKELILSAKDICESTDGDQMLLATVYSFHGCILSDSGEIDQALFYFGQQVKNRRNYFGDLARKGQKATMTDEIQLANAYNNLAGILCAHGRYSEAELNNRLSLALKQRWMKEVDLDYLLSLTYSNMANVFGQQQLWDESSRWYEKALDIEEKKHYVPRRALIFHNYGCMSFQQGSIEKAKGLLTEAVQLRTEKLGDHYDTASSLHMLACCYRKLGDFVNARDLLQEALRILESPHLRDRKRIARSKFHLSLVLAELNDAAAPKIRQDAVDLRREVLGTACKDGDREEDFDELVPYI